MKLIIEIDLATLEEIQRGRSYSFWDAAEQVASRAVSNAQEGGMEGIVSWFGETVATWLLED